MGNIHKISRITASLQTLRSQMDTIKAQHSELAGSYGIMRGKALSAAKHRRQAHPEVEGQPNLPCMPPPDGGQASSH